MSLIMTTKLKVLKRLGSSFVFEARILMREKEKRKEGEREGGNE